MACVMRRTSEQMVAVKLDRLIDSVVRREKKRFRSEVEKLAEKNIWKLGRLRAMMDFLEMRGWIKLKNRIIRRLRQYPPYESVSRSDRKWVKERIEKLEDKVFRKAFETEVKKFRRERPELRRWINELADFKFLYRESPVIS